MKTVIKLTHEVKKNKSGYQRDMAILHDWQNDISKIEYINRLYKIYIDYGMIKKDVKK